MLCPFILNNIQQPKRGGVCFILYIQSVTLSFGFREISLALFVCDGEKGWCFYYRNIILFE